MVQGIRYRQGIDRHTGKPISGLAHLIQSLDVIWTTRFGELVMDLGFGSDNRQFLAEDITPELALDIYDHLAVTSQRDEPEYRVSEFQLVKLTQSGGLGLKHSGIYFPEGRFDNYDIAQAFTAAPTQLGVN